MIPCGHNNQSRLTSEVSTTKADYMTLGNASNRYTLSMQNNKVDSLTFRFGNALHTVSTFPVLSRISRDRRCY
uniref:Tub domain-containing protein n=1 Tax=Panagrellus redivivus TaxID=6233 RepID=A0A7E4ZTI0_PANRE